jgi:hypothetical protein
MIKLTSTKLNKLFTKCYTAKSISKNEWQMNTIGGELYIKLIDNDFVHMKFLEPKKANTTHLKNEYRFNPFSGKFNFHWFKKTPYDYKIAELMSYITNFYLPLER